MRRNKELLLRRIKMVGLFYSLKRDVEGKTGKVARHELAQIFGVHIHTINNDLTNYRKTLTNYTKKIP